MRDTAFFVSARVGRLAVMIMLVERGDENARKVLFDRPPTAQELKEAFQLTDDSGRPIPFRVTQLIGANHLDYYALRPQRALSPGTVALDPSVPYSDESEREWGQLRFRFLVSESTTPSIPHIASVSPAEIEDKPEPWQRCESPKMFFSVSHDGDILVAHIGRRAPKPGRPNAVSAIFFSERAWFGLPWRDPGVYIWFGAFNYAGGFSGWTPAIAVPSEAARVGVISIRPKRGCTCKTVHHQEPPMVSATVTLGVIIVGFSRRRRWRAASSATGGLAL